MHAICNGTVYGRVVDCMNMHMCACMRTPLRLCMERGVRNTFRLLYNGLVYEKDGRVGFDSQCLATIESFTSRVASTCDT